MPVGHMSQQMKFLEQQRLEDFASHGGLAKIMGLKEFKLPAKFTHAEPFELVAYFYQTRVSMSLDSAANHFVACFL